MKEKGVRKKCELLKQGVQILSAKIGVLSNNPDLLYIDEYLNNEVQRGNPQILHFSSNYHSANKVAFTNAMDMHLYLLDLPGLAPDLQFTGKNVTLIGDISGWEINPPDRRYTVYGNGGLLSKVCLYALEEYHGVYSLHATSIYNEQDHHLLIFVGSGGAGKTIMLLHGCLNHGYKVFTTEYTHFKVTDHAVSFYKGSLYDNIRLSNLQKDFAGAKEKLGISIPDSENMEETKMAVNFEPLQTRSDVIENPRITIVFPKIEVHMRDAVIHDITSTYNLVFKLYNNAGEKINTPRLLYGVLPYSSFDNPQLVKKRYEAVREFVDKANIIKSQSIFAGINNCWNFD